MCCRGYESERICNLPVGESLVTVTSTSTSSSTRQYVNASYVDEPVLLIDRTAAGSVGAGTDERFYYHRNQQYSITALTDNSGTPVERYAYTAYGEPTILDGPGTTTRTASFINNPYLYTAQEYDPETALYHFNARMYEGRKGRFLSHDPIMYPDGASAYAISNSVNGVDPAGLSVIAPPLPFPTPTIPPVVGGAGTVPGIGTAIVGGVTLGLYIDYFTNPLLAPGYARMFDRLIVDVDITIDIDSRKGNCKCRCSVQGSPPAHCPARYVITYPGECTASSHSDALHWAALTAGGDGCHCPSKGYQIKHCNCVTR